MLSGVQGRGCGGLKRYSKSCSKTYLRKNRPRYPVALNVGRRDTLSTLMGFRDSKLELSMLLILSIGLALISSTALFPHTNHPSHFTAQPTTSTTPSVMSVVTGNDSTLYWNDNFTSTTSSWKSLDGSSNYAPGLCSSGPGKVELVVIGASSDGVIYHKGFSSSSWSAWDEGPTDKPAFAFQPHCVVLNNILYVVTLGTDFQIYLTTMNLTSGRWLNWVNLHGESNYTPAFAVSPNRLDLVATGLNNEVYHMALPGGIPTDVWEVPGPAPGYALGSPSAVSNGTTLHVVIQGTDHSVWWNSMNLSNGDWSGWVYLNGGTSSPPAIGLDSTGTLHIVVRGLDNGIYHDTIPSTGPPGTTWDSAIGGLTSDTPAIGFSGTNLMLLVRGYADDGLYTDTLTGSTWGAWTSAMGATPDVPTIAEL